MKTNIKTNILQGITILGLGALLFGATAMTPAHADGFAKVRGRDGAVVTINVGGPVRVNTDFVVYCGPDHRPEGKFWVYDRHDNCWRRDRCR